jgi:hypothetical protein
MHEAHFRSFPHVISAQQRQNKVTEMTDLHLSLFKVITTTVRLHSCIYALCAAKL